MSRWMRNALLFTAGLLAAGAVWVVLALTPPDISFWQGRYTLDAETCDRGAGTPACVEVTWLGVATLVFDDGETRLLVDGFFSRPGRFDLLAGRPVAPDPEAIDAGLRRAGVDTAAAVMTVHSHYDHAMDAAEVAKRLDATLVGSASTAMVGRGGGLAEDRIVAVESGRPMAFGAFEVTFHASQHVPLPAGQGAIGHALAAPLVPPAPVADYVEGGSYTIEIAHPAGVALVQGSAGFVEGGLAEVRADHVLLGIGGLDRQPPEYRAAYYRELLDRVGARQVLPIHWDDFTQPPGVVEPFPVGFGDVSATLAELEEKALLSEDLEMALLPAWQTAVLMRGKAP